MSRFKVTLKDISKANKEGIQKLGAKGIVEIDNQLRFNQLYPNILGTIFFTYHDLVPGRNIVKDAGIAILKARWNSKKIEEKMAENLKK